MNPLQTKAARLQRAIDNFEPYNHERKVELHSAAKSFLKHYAKEVLHLTPGDYDLRTNRAGIAVSGEVTLHGERLYIQLSVSCVNLPPFLVRSCKGRKDYTGGRNHFFTPRTILHSNLAHITA